MSLPNCKGVGKEDFIFLKREENQILVRKSQRSRKVFLAWERAKHGCRPRERGPKKRDLKGRRKRVRKKNKN